MHKRNQQGFVFFELILLVVVLAVISLVVWRVVLHKSGVKSVVSSLKSGKLPAGNYDKVAAERLTNGKCSGVGPVKLVPPMKLDQIGMVLPYGITVGGHVTPIDHQYYTGLNYHALRDSYDVVAVANGTIVSIQHRGDKVNTPIHSVDVPSSDEYRLVIAHTCSFITYLDLVTSLDDSIKSQLPAGWDPKGTSNQNFSIPIKQGQVIGHIGGQTLDFAVWDLSKPLKGFINPTAYTNAEAWKIYTAPTSDYFDPAIRAAIIAKYIRTAAPIDGQIDYDQAGKLIGTWFAQGSNGYAGSNSPGGQTAGYWQGHLAIIPDAITPSVMVVSTGTYTGIGGANDAKQLWIKTGPDPAKVTPTSGLVKYELMPNSAYLLPNGSHWDNASFAAGLSAYTNGGVQSTMLVQMTDGGHIKVQFFPGKTAAQVSGFTGATKVYDRGDGAHDVNSNTATH